MVFLERSLWRHVTDSTLNIELPLSSPNILLNKFNLIDQDVKFSHPVLQKDKGQLQWTKCVGFDSFFKCIFGDAIDRDHVPFMWKFINLLHGQLEVPDLFCLAHHFKYYLIGIGHQVKFLIADLLNADLSWYLDIRCFGSNCTGWVFYAVALKWMKLELHQPFLGHRSFIFIVSKF